jgi:diguanylate cyclase (GGDEF)-like protein
VQSRRQQPGAGFALLSADIDHFKRINDQFGHAVGDEVLRRVAQAMRQACRPTDRVGRVGGEEFLVLLPGAPRSMVSSISERLVSAVRRLEFVDVAPGLRVTISVGVAMADGVMEPVDLLLKRVDRALYEAKHAGRDRIVQAAAAV